MEVSYFLHATEDPEKVNGSVASALVIASEPEVEELEGHFGNKISHVRFHVTGPEATALVKRLGAKLPKDVKEEVVSGLSQGMDEHAALFLRLDKQALVEGRLALSDADPVRVKVKPRLFELKEDPARFYARLIGG